MSAKNEPPSDELKIETLKTIYDHSYQLVTLADNKATAILTINGIMITVVLALAGLKDDFFQIQNIWDIIAIVFLGLYLISCIISIIFSIMTISPLQNAGVNPKKHTFYYVNILEYKDQDEYNKGLTDVLSDYANIQKSFAEQIFALSLVNTRKYKFVKLCIWMLLISFLLMGVLITFVVL